MTNNEAFEEALDLMINAAVKIVHEKESETLAQIEPIQFSSEHENRMKKLFDKINHKRKQSVFMLYSKRIACVLLVLFMLAGVSICSVNAWRTKFLNFFFDKNNPNSDFNYSALEGTHYSDDNISLEYIPWGFEVKKCNVSDESIIVYFEKDALFFEVNINELYLHSNIDTENATVDDIEINGYKGILVIKAGLTQVLWCDDEFTFYVAGNISKEELLKISKNFKKI